MSLFFILKFYILCVCITVYVCICVCLCVCKCMCMYVRVCVWRGDVFATSAWSEENVQKQYSFYHVDSRVRTHQLSMKAHDRNPCSEENSFRINVSYRAIKNKTKSNQSKNKTKQKEIIKCAQAYLNFGPKRKFE